MNKCLIFQGCQRKGYAYAVVRTQRGVFRHHPAILHHSVDRIAQKIVLCAGIGLADHVQMPLQNHARLSLAARTRGFFQYQVACDIDDRGNPARASPLDQMCDQCSLMQR
jgi:hypothetical protein